MSAIVTDLVGSPAELIDPERGEVAGRSVAGLWGRTVWSGEVSTPLRFPGQYFDDESGLHYNRHRYYQPDTGRYLTLDPLGLAPAPNPVMYPHNPTGWVDPLGLAPCALDNYQQRDAGSHSAEGAHSAVAGRNLPRQLASEQQMSEVGRPLAGAGTTTRLRAADGLAEQYGGRPEDWSKMGSSSYRGIDGHQFETHWYQNLATGERFEFKTKVFQ